MRAWPRCLAVGALLALGAAQAQAPLNVRIALVIGNAAYVAAPLQNPANDARAMGEALRGLGFQVIEVRDASKAQMAAGIASAQTALKGKQGVGMLYYAGHGLQVDWRNYMVPVDAKMQKAQDVVEQAIDVNSVINAFEAAGNRMNILVLDACRDNPFAGTGSAKGLAQLDAPPGTFLAYATAPGNVAEDGDAGSGNGLYTQHLVEELKQPDARIEDVFKRVRIGVRQRSQGRQIPWESTSLEDDFYFGKGLSTAPREQIANASPQLLARRQGEFEQEKLQWDRIRNSANADDFFAFLKANPSGYMSEQAQFKIDQLQKTVLVVQPTKDGVLPLKSGTRRFEVGDEWTYERLDRLAFKTTTLTNTVTAADEKTAVINNGLNIRDQFGMVLKDAYGEKDPGLLLVPADLAVGKKWHTAFKNKNDRGLVTQMFFDGRVVGIEPLELKAGRFKTFKVVLDGTDYHPNGTTKLTFTLWVDPETLLTVKSEYLILGGGRKVFDSTDTYIALKLVPRAR